MCLSSVSTFCGHHASEQYQARRAAVTSHDWAILEWRSPVVVGRSRTASRYCTPYAPLCHPRPRLPDCGHDGETADMMASAPVQDIWARTTGYAPNGPSPG